MAENRNNDPQERFNEVKKKWESTIDAMKSVTQEGITEVLAIINNHLKNLNLPVIEIDIKGKEPEFNFDFTDSASKFSRILEEREKNKQKGEFV